MKLIPKTLLVVGLMFLATQAYARDNFCGECHTSKELAAFGNVLAWNKNVYQGKDTMCPGMLAINKDLYFTESRLAKFDTFLTEMEHKTRRYPEYMKEDLAKAEVAYADLAAGSVPTSIDGFSGPDLKLKKKVHEVYETYNKLMGDYSMEKVIGLLLVGTMVVSLLLFLGLKNTLKG